MKNKKHLIKSYVFYTLLFLSDFLFCVYKTLKKSLNFLKLHRQAITYCILPGQKNHIFWVDIFILLYLRQHIFMPKCISDGYLLKLVGIYLIEAIPKNTHEKNKTTYHFWPNYHTVCLGFSKLLEKLVVKYLHY